MHHVVVTRLDLDRYDVAGHPGREGQLAVAAHRPVLGHEKASAPDHPFEGAKDATTAGKLRVGGHLHVGRHPGKLAGFGDDGVVGLEQKFEHGHGGADDLTFHDRQPTGSARASS